MATFELSAHMTVRPGQLEGFKKQAAEIIRLTKEKDTQTLRYDWFLTNDGTECEVRELYESPQGLIEHKAHIGAALHKLFELYADSAREIRNYREGNGRLAARFDHALNQSNGPAAKGSCRHQSGRVNAVGAHAFRNRRRGLSDEDVRFEDVPHDRVMPRRRLADDAFVRKLGQPAHR